MKILALEFSCPRRSVALLDDAAASPVLAVAAESEGRGNLGLIERALGAGNCKREEIVALAIGLGPGSYTGIRGAIALAQGWQLGRDVKTLGISTVECLAAQAQKAGARGDVNIVIDAQRNEFYLARYHLNESCWSEVEALRLAAFSEIEALLAEGKTLIGPGLSEWFSGATDLNPDAATLGLLARGRRDFIPGEKLEPIYLRETGFKKAPVPRIIP
jgi:tRNA threonylcarbamoyl adenosine modification protein YeaZ